MSGLKRLFPISLTVCGHLLWWLPVRRHLWRPAVKPARRLCRMSSSTRTGRVTAGPLQAVELPGTRLERSDDVGDGARQNQIEGPLQQKRAKLDVGDQSHPAAGARL